MFDETGRFLKLVLLASSAMAVSACREPSSASIVCWEEPVTAATHVKGYPAKTMVKTRTVCAPIAAKPRLQTIVSTGGATAGLPGHVHGTAPPGGGVAAVSGPGGVSASAPGAAAVSGPGGVGAAAGG